MVWVKILISAADEDLAIGPVGTAVGWMGIKSSDLLFLFFLLVGLPLRGWYKSAAVAVSCKNNVMFCYSSTMCLPKVKERRRKRFQERGPENNREKEGKLKLPSSFNSYYMTRWLK